MPPIDRIESRASIGRDREPDGGDGLESSSDLSLFTALEPILRTPEERGDEEGRDEILPPFNPAFPRCILFYMIAETS
jgi:hypothetical protein